MATKTFLFVDQVGSTEQLTRLGDAEAQVLRRALFDLLRQATEVSGGQEVDFTGDGLFCAFDGAAEAVDAAVAMQQLVWSFNGRRPEASHMAIRCGLNSGEPLESESGGFFGTAVVVAARLCAAAEGGQVLVSPLVRGLVEPRGVHEFRPVGRLDLKGVPDPVAAAAVVWEPDARRPLLPAVLEAAGRAAEFVGRQRELNAVAAAWEQACRGGRRLVAVSGDHGAGVTRLLAESAYRLHERGATVWAGRGQGPEGRLGPWAEAIAEWAGAVPRAELRLALGGRAPDLLRLVPGLADLVPRLPAPPPVDPSAQLFAIADAVDELAARWSEIEPLVVVLDGLEDADPGSLTVLRRLATSPRAGRVLLLVGYEPSSVGSPRLLAALQAARPDVDLRLVGLADDDVRALAESVAGEPLDDATLHAIVAESEGNPYFVLEMIRAHRERGLARQVQEAADRSGELRADLRLQREELTLALRELQQLREAGTDAVPARLDPDGTPPAPGNSPYRGLPAFRSEDADTFFGREALVAEMVAALLSSRFLAVVGPSGSGKSSAVRAGLLPALARGALPGSAAWAVALCTPGPDPLGALAGALAGPALVEEGTRRLEREPLAALAAELTGDVRTVLVVDQLEELWTAATEPDRHRVLDLLVEAATGDEERVLVVVCLRADYYGRTAEHAGLTSLLPGSQVLVGPMTTAELRAAVELPARRGDWLLEPGLAQAVIDDVAGEPGALPLLSTAMLETWERRRGRSLTLAGYAETGGARRAIAALADATVDELDPAEQEVARRLLLRLAAPTAEGIDVARPARLTELVVDESTRRVLTRLAERRLVTVGETTAQVAHEALLREWPRLQRWLEADRDGRRLHQQIATAACDWETAGREDGALLRGARLAAAADWRTEHDPDLTGLERDYLDASVAGRDRDLRRARRTTHRFQVLAGVLVALLIGTGVATGFAVVRGREAAGLAADTTARGLAAQAIATSGTSLDTALLLAAEGYRRAPSADTENGLLSVLNAAGDLAGYRDELPQDLVASALSPDGKALAVLTASRELRLFDTATWRPRGGPLVRVIGAPGQLRFDPSGTQLAYTDSIGAHLVDVRTGKPVGPTLGLDPLPRVAFSSDGTLVGVDAGNLDSVFRIFDHRTGVQLATIPAAAGDLRPRSDEVAVLLPGGKTVLQLYRTDGTRSGPPVPLPGIGGAWVRYTPDGRRLLVTSADGSTVVLDADTLTSVGQPILGSATAFGLGGPAAVGADVDPRGDLVALALNSGTVEVVSTADGSLRATIGGPVGAPVTFLDDHRFLASTPGGTAEYDLGQATPFGATTSLPDPIGGLMVEPDGERALVGQGQDLVELDRNGKQTATGVRLPVDTDGPMALSPDGRLVAALGHPPGDNPAGPPADQQVNLAVADRGTGVVRFTITVPGGGDAPIEGGLAFSPDGRRLAVGTSSGLVMVLDSTTGGILAHAVDVPVPAPGAVPVPTTDTVPVRDLRWSRDGTVLYEGGADGVLRFLDSATLTLQTALLLPPASGLNVILSVPRTTLLAVVADTGQVFFFDTARPGNGVTEMAGVLAAQLLALAASPDGRLIAGVGRDGALHVWDRVSLHAIGPPLPGKDTSTRGIVWLDRDHLLTGSFDGRLIAWDLAPSDWAARACALAGRNLTRTEWAEYLPHQPYRRTCEAR